jgi:hypothetical protein
VNDTTGFQYDVAFSFLSEDEAVARALEERVRDRLSTFIYSRRQGEIAGSDGEVTFRRVFGNEARTVAILFRDGWGRTPWTRIEETAIRDRAYAHGYEFTTWVTLDAKASLPEWLPKSRLWIDFDRLGVNGAAAVLEERVRLAGGAVREETAIEAAARVERSIVAADRKEAIFRSEQGVHAARMEMQRLAEELEKGASAMSMPNMPFEFRKGRAALGEVFVVVGSGHSLSVGLDIRYANSLDGSGLGVILWRGLDPYTQSIRLEEPKKVIARKYRFDLSGSEDPGWRETEGASRFLTSAQVADHSLKLLLKGAEDYRLRQSRRSE